MDEIPSITKQLRDIKLDRGIDRCDPPSYYFELLGNCLSKKDIHDIVQYIKRKLNANGQ